MGRQRQGIILCLSLIADILLPVCGQVGVTICACQPSVYTFTFNFSAPCDIGTVESRPGIFDADCFQRGFAIGSPEDVNDTVPIQVTTVSVMELSKDLGVLTQTPYVDIFRDGDSFTYTSLLSTPDNITGLTPDMVPGGIQLGIVGVNQLEEPITNVWIILFDNECGIFPVLEIGDQIGWTILSDLQEPLQGVCPLAPPIVPTTSPTINPTSIPSFRPTEFTSTQPSTIPTIVPSVAPTTSCPPVRRPGNSPSIIEKTAMPSLNGTSSSSRTMQSRRHHFYTSPQYDGRGLGVGTPSPSTSPLECPELDEVDNSELSELSVPKKKVKDNNDDIRGSKLVNKKNMMSIKDLNKQLPQPKEPTISPIIDNPTNSKKMAMGDKYDTRDDDDLEFVEIEKTLSPSSVPTLPAKSTTIDPSVDHIDDIESQATITPSQNLDTFGQIEWKNRHHPMKGMMQKNDRQERR